jgi:hypothetical protein
MGKRLTKRPQVSDELGVIKLVSDTEITTRHEVVEGFECGLALLTAARRKGYLPPHHPP